MFDKIKAFFNKSWSIFLARMEILAGFIVGVIGLIDWASLANIDFDAGFSNNQMFWFAIGLVIKGVVGEIGRRQNTVTVDAQLVPANLKKEAEKKAK